MEKQYTKVIKHIPKLISNKGKERVTTTIANALQLKLKLGRGG